MKIFGGMKKKYYLCTMNEDSIKKIVIITVCIIGGYIALSVIFAFVKLFLGFEIIDQILQLCTSYIPN